MRAHQSLLLRRAIHQHQHRAPLRLDVAHRARPSRPRIARDLSLRRSRRLQRRRAIRPVIAPTHARVHRVHVRAHDQRDFFPPSALARASRTRTPTYVAFATPPSTPAAASRSSTRASFHHHPLRALDARANALHGIFQIRERRHLGVRPRGPRPVRLQRAPSCAPSTLRTPRSLPRPSPALVDRAPTRRRTSPRRRESRARASIPSLSRRGRGIIVDILRARLRGRITSPRARHLPASHLRGRHRRSLVSRRAPRLVSRLRRRVAPRARAKKCMARSGRDVIHRSSTRHRRRRRARDRATRRRVDKILFDARRVSDDRGAIARATTVRRSRD